MRYFKLLFFLFFFATAVLHAQVHDSSFFSADSTPLNTRKIVKGAIERYYDSLQRERVFREVKEHGKPLNEFLAEREKELKKEKRNRFIRIGLGVLFLIALVVSRARRRKKPSDQAD